MHQQQQHQQQQSPLLSSQKPRLPPNLNLNKDQTLILPTTKTPPSQPSPTNKGSNKKYEQKDKNSIRI